MYKFSSLFFLLFFGFTFAQEHINFQEGTYQELMLKAKKEKKIVFIDAFAEWCGPCKLMDKNVFTKKKVADYYNANFINARIDMEKGEGREIARKFGVRAYPTFLFINSDGTLISQNVGYMEELVFLGMAESINSPYYKKGNLKDQFDAGEKNPFFLQNVMKLNATSDYDFAKMASERYFENKSKEKKLSKEEVGMLLYFIKSIDDKNMQVYLKRKEEITAFLPLKDYEEYHQFFLISKIEEESITNKNNTIDTSFFLKKVTPLVGKEAAQKKLMQFQLRWYEKNKQYEEYVKTALKFYENAENYDSGILLKSAKIIAEHSSDKNALEKAVIWAEKSVNNQENAENTYILAKIYSKIGENDKAKKFAEIAKKITESMQKDTSLVESLLKSLK